MLFEAKVTPPPEYEPYGFKIQGMVHHMVSSLYPENKKGSAYGKLYFLEFNAANDIRLTRAANCDVKKEILIKLNKILEKYKPYVKFYKTMHQKITVDFALAAKENRDPKKFFKHYYHEPNSDMRQYNNPTCFAIFETTDDALPSHRYILIYKKENTMPNIDHESMHADPMTYSLLWLTCYTCIQFLFFILFFFFRNKAIREKFKLKNRICFKVKEFSASLVRL